MYIETVPNRNSPPAILLRESYRKDGKVVKRTLANLTKWPGHIVEGLRHLLKGTPLVSPDTLFEIKASTPHGHVAAVLGTIRRLALDKTISSASCRKRDLVLAMISERLLHPCSKLATTRLWHTTTLAEELGVGDADENELYEAMDWLLERKDRIEDALARHHLEDGAMVLYDISSSYYEGSTCSLARYGHNRDKKEGRRIIVYGLLTDEHGCPVAVDVYPGNTGDPTTVADQVEKIRGRFGLKNVILVGDRGMLTQTNIDKIKEAPGMGWITALRSAAIRKLLSEGTLQLSLFDKQNLAEIRSPDFPGERLVACFNPLLQQDRRRTREELIEATQKNLLRVSKEIARHTKNPLSDKDIGLRVGKVINAYKVAKHFRVHIKEGALTWELVQTSIDAEAQLDGIYVIRTNESAERLSGEDAVRNYKRLTQVEFAFRSLKSLDLLVRPIRHRVEDRVRAHIFICMLAYYIQWHMRQDLKELLFDDEELGEDRSSRDPVKPATPSLSAAVKKKNKQNRNGMKVHSFTTLIADLGTLCRNRCRTKNNPDAPGFSILTNVTQMQEKALKLLGVYPVR